MAADDIEGGGLESDLIRVQTQFENAIDLFQETVRRVRDGEELSHTDADRVTKALFHATNTLLSYKVRIYDERKRQEGISNGYSVDLDEARSKVGRLLDRLRAAHGAGEIPGEHG